MRNLVIMPAMAQNRERMNLGEYAEEATIIVDEPVRPAKHFIEANTQEATLHHLKHECITPVFSKDNELTINHAAFVETIQDAAQSFFSGEKVEQADIRVSHIIKGRIPAAIHKPANQLLESDKTIYYERAAFSIDVPTIYETVGENKLNLSIVGVRAYNQMNLYSKKSSRVVPSCDWLQESNLLQYVHLYRWLQGRFKSKQYNRTLSCSIGTVQ